MSTVQRFATDSPYETALGFSRAIRIGNRVIFTLTGPVMQDGAPLPSDAYGQGLRCMEIINDALQRAGGTIADVVRTEIHFTRQKDIDSINRFHKDVFGTVRPVTKILPVPCLTDPAWLIELEVEAALKVSD